MSEKIEEETPETTESMNEDPLGGCKALWNGALICIGLAGLLWLGWWLTHR